MCGLLCNQVIKKKRKIHIKTTIFSTNSDDTNKSLFYLKAYVITEDIALRDFEGSSNPLGLSELISTALPPDILKKELRPGDYMVRY